MTVITIPIQDWVDEYDASPIKPSNQEDMIAAMQETAIKPTEMARLAIVARERGEADGEILPPNKISLNLGAAYAISQMIARRKVEVQVKDRVYEARQFVADVTAGEGEGPDGSGEPLVDIHDPRAVERATRYLLNVVTGYIWGRLVAIAANRGDVQGAAEELKARIDEMVGRLT